MSRAMAHSDMIDTDRSLPMEEVARILSVSVSTVRELIKQGTLQAHRVGTGGRNIRVRETALEAYRTGATINITAPRAATRRKPNPRHAAALDMLKSLGV